VNGTPLAGVCAIATTSSSAVELDLRRHLARAIGDEDAPNPLTRQLSSVGLRRKAAVEAKEREKEIEKEGLSWVSSVSSKVAVRPSPLRRETDEGVGTRESITSVGITGSEGYMDSSIR
jgi:hypothetical protein